jgi:ketosteroid isomerase-like protein
VTDGSVDLVRRFYDAWNQHGPEVLTGFASPDVELEDAPELPDSGRWRGRDAVQRRLEEVASAVGGGWVEVREVRDFGGTVLVQMEWRLDDRSRGAHVGDVCHVVGVVGGEIVSIRVFLSESDAIEAATGTRE